MRKITLPTRFYEKKPLNRWYSGVLSLFALFCSFGLSAQTGTIAIGAGTATTSTLPISSCWGYSYTQQIIPASQFAVGGGAAGQITKIRFYYDSGAIDDLDVWNQWTVYIGQTNKTSFTSNTDWVPASALTQVFSGTITPVAGQWMELTFSTPFNYDGVSNIVIGVDENVEDYACSASWGSYTGGENTGIYFRDDEENPNPASPPEGSRVSSVNRIQFEGVLASCLVPTGLTAVANTINTATVTWTASTSAPAGGYDYYYSATNTAPAASQTPSGTVAAGTLTTPLSGLTPNTTYYVWVRSHCSDSDMSSWSSAVSFTTPCDSTTIPYYQDFESVTTPALPSCTTIQNAGTGNNWNTTDSPGYGFSNKTLRYSYNYTNPANAWFYTQGVNLTAGQSYRINFKYGNSSTNYTEQMAVAYGTANEAASMTVLQDYTSINSAASVTTFIDFIPQTSGVYYIGFRAHSAANQATLYLDDISVVPTPACDLPTAVTAANTGFTTGTINWSAPVAAPANGYQYYYSTSETAPVEGTTPSGTVAAGLTTAPLTGLTANTTYYVWVRSNCGPDSYSTWVAGASFFTGYCTPAPTSVDGDGITNVTMGSINNTTEAEEGNYGNYTAMSTSADAGSTVNFSITYNTGYEYGTKIWVDWNNDADFDDEGEEVYFGLSGDDEPTTLSGSFTIPAIASLAGTHTLRIGGTDNDEGGTPCYEGSYGTYEDYTLNVTIPAAPAITSFTPASYCAATGLITITGTALANPTAVTVGGTAVTVESHTATQITATVPAGATGVVAVTTVGGTATTTDVFAVTTPPTLTLSAANTTICAGASSTAVTITAGASDYDTYVWTPSTGVTGSAAAGWVFTGTATTEYILTASNSDGPCIVDVEFTLNVNPLPTPVVATAAATEVCYNNVVAVTANGGNTPLTATYCTPTLGQSGQTSDFINNFSFGGIVNNASGDAASDYTYYSNLTANVVAGQATPVSVQGGGNQTFRIWIDLNQDGQFTANESVFSTATGSSSAQTGNITIPVTALNGTTRMRVGCRWSSAIADAAFCGHTGYGEYEDYNITITGATNGVQYVWTPSTGLYTDAAATVAYTGQPATVVYAKVIADVTYTATASTDADCTISDDIALTVVTTPAPDAEATQTFCNEGTVAGLEADGDNLTWYAAATGGNALTATTALVTGTTYYASQTVNGCESFERTPVAVTITVVAVEEIEDAVACNEFTLPELATGAYYTATGGAGETLEEGTVITETTTLYVYAASGECSDESSFTVTINSAVAVEAQSPQVVAVSETPATIEDIVVVAEGTVTWYATLADAEAGTNALAAGTAIAAGTTYYAVQTVGECTSEVTAVEVSEILGNDKFDVRSFSYYPNPVKDILNLQYSADINSVKVYNLLGQLVLTQEPNATSAIVDMAPLAEGTYTVNVTAGGAVKTIKVVKKLN